KVDKSRQTMTVYVNGAQRYTWLVSTARAGYYTPTGSFSVKRTAAMWFSRKYDMSPMPHSVFFLGGFAVHGSYHSGLGRPASHGCVRLAPGNAAILYNLVVQHGYDDSKIVINN